MQRVYKIKDIAEKLQISRRKVSLLINTGYLKAINTNPDGKVPVYRVFEKDLQEYLEKYKI